MAKKLTKKGAQAVTADLDKLATLFEHDYEILGVEERIAHDFALRCDMLSDHLEKVALTGDDVVKEQGFDPDDIGRETAGPLENEPDEPYMRGEFDQQENRELREKQQGGEIGPDRMTTEPQTPRPGVQAALGTLAAAIGDGTLPKEASAQVEKALGLATKIVREAKKDLPPEFLKNIEKKKEEAKDKDEGKDKKAADDSEEEAAESMQEKKEEEAKEEKKASHGYDLTAE